MDDTATDAETATAAAHTAKTPAFLMTTALPDTLPDAIPVYIHAIFDVVAVPVKPATTTTTGITTIAATPDISETPATPNSAIPYPITPISTILHLVILIT